MPMHKLIGSAAIALAAIGGLGGCAAASHASHHAAPSSSSSSSSSSSGAPAAPVQSSYHCTGSSPSLVGKSVPSVEAASHASEAACQSYIARLGFTPAAGGLTPSDESNGVACIAVNPNSDPWQVTILNSASTQTTSAADFCQEFLNNSAWSVQQSPA